MDKSAINAAFANLTLKDLNRLRRMSDYPIKSNLRKAELVDALENHLRKDPVKLLFQLPLYDLEILAQLCRMDRDSCLCLEEFPDILYIQEFNICEWDFSKGGCEHELWLTDDMYSLIAPFIDQVVDDVTEGGRCIIDFFFWGMIWLYGFLPAEEFIKALKKEFGKNDKEWWPMYAQLVRYFPFTDYNNEDRFIVHPAIGEYEYMLGERRSRGFDRKPLKEYSFEEIMKVGASGPYFRYGEESGEYESALKALLSCGQDKETAEARLSHIWMEVQDIDGPSRSTQIFSRAIGGEPVLDSREELDSLTEAIFTYMNNIPRWCLGGRVPTDIRRTPQEQAQLLSFTTAMDRVVRTLENTPKVGRNDPCPCGSGLKYKNCHGKNFS